MVVRFEVVEVVHLPGFKSYNLIYKISVSIFSCKLILKVPNLSGVRKNRNFFPQPNPNSNGASAEISIHQDIMISLMQSKKSQSSIHDKL